LWLGLLSFFFFILKKIIIIIIIIIIIKYFELNNIIHINFLDKPSKGLPTPDPKPINIITESSKTIKFTVPVIITTKNLPITTTKTVPIFYIITKSSKTIITAPPTIITSRTPKKMPTKDSALLPILFPTQIISKVSNRRNKIKM